MIQNLILFNTRNLLSLIIIWLLLASTSSWWAHQQQRDSQKLQIISLSEHLSPYLVAEPELAAELLTFSHATTSLQLKSLILYDADGKELVQVGDSIQLQVLSARETEVDGIRYWRQPVGDNHQLVIASVDIPFSFYWFFLTFPLLIAILACSWLMRQQQILWTERLWHSVPKTLCTVEGTEVSQLNVAIQQLVEQHTHATHQASLNLQIMQSQQQLHVEQQHSIRKQLSQAESLVMSQARTLQLWQLTVAQSRQFDEAELRHWLSVLSLYQSDCQSVSRANQKITQWFATTMLGLQAMWPAAIQLLPDEDHEASRFLAELDDVALKHLLHSLVLAIKPLIEGKELLIGYRLHQPQRDKLQIRIQYTGKSLSAQSRHVMAKGPETEPQWSEIPFEICFHLLKMLSIDLHIQELADLGTRLELSVPLTGLVQQQCRRFQNLVVCDPRPCRLELWRHSLLGVSEQVVVAATVAELKTVLQSRLIDTVVVHWGDDPLTDDDASVLNLLQQRYHLIFWASTENLRRCGIEPGAGTFTAPLMLAHLESLPQQGAQFDSQQLLIVDDNPTNLSFIKAMLSDKDISIDFASTGLEALKLANHSRYQLILMDIQLPDLNGVEVTKRIRQLRHHQQTIILAFTGHALPEEAAGFRVAGMDDVMIKPLDARKIAHILSRLSPLTETQPHC